MTPGRIQPLDEVYKEIKDSISQEEASLRYIDTLELLEERSYELQDNFWDDVDDSFGLAVHETGWTNVDEPQPGSLLAEAAVREVIERDLVLLRTENSPIIEVSPDRRAVAFRIVESQAPRQQDFSEVSEQVHAEWTKERSQTEARSALEEKFRLLESGQLSIGELINQSLGSRDLYKLKDLGYIGRRGAAPTAVLEAAFFLPKPTADDSVKYSLAESSPDFPVGVIVAVSSVQQPQQENGGAGVSALLARDIGDKEVLGMLDSARESMDVSVTLP